MGTVKVLVEGNKRVKISDFSKNDEFSEDEGDAETIEALQKTIASEFEKYAKIKKNIPEEALAAVANAEDPRQLVDLIAGHLGIEVEEKQKLLENLVISERLEQAYSHMQ